MKGDFSVAHLAPRPCKVKANQVVARVTAINAYRSQGPSKAINTLPVDNDLSSCEVSSQGITGAVCQSEITPRIASTSVLTFRATGHFRGIDVDDTYPLVAASYRIPVMDNGSRANDARGRSEDQQQ